MTTAADLIDATLDWVLGGTDEPVGVLAAPLSMTATTVELAHSGGRVAPGTHLAVGLEVMRVVATNPTANQVTVLRGQRGSRQSAHPGGAIVQIAPRFSRWAVFRALNDDLASLSGAGLFQMKTVDLTWNTAVSGYDLAGVQDVEDIYSVRYETPGPSREWPLLRRDRWQLVRHSPVDEFSSGYSLIIHDGGYPGYRIRVAYKAPFTPFVDESTTVADTGLPPTAADLPPLGAAMKLAAGLEQARTRYEAQPDTRRADEVQVGSMLGMSGGWARLRAQRIVEELRRLNRRYPPVRV